jgi:acyl carrier protein
VARARGGGASVLLASWPGTEEVALERLGISPVPASEVIDWALAALVEAAPAAPAASSLLLADIDWALFRAAYAQRGDERFLGELGAMIAAVGGSRWSQLSPEAAAAALRELVANEAREVLGAGADAALPLETPFTELGMDSVMALQLMTRLSRALETRLATVLVFEHPTVAALAEHLVKAVLGKGETTGAPGDEEGSEAGSADVIDDDLSEDELVALLAHKLGASGEPGAGSQGGDE